MNNNNIVIGENLTVKGKNKFVVGVGGKWQKEIDLTPEQIADLRRIITEAKEYSDKQDKTSNEN